MTFSSTLNAKFDRERERQRFNKMNNTSYGGIIIIYKLKFILPDQIFACLLWNTTAHQCDYE